MYPLYLAPPLSNKCIIFDVTGHFQHNLIDRLIQLLKHSYTVVIHSLPNASLQSIPLANYYLCYTIHCKIILFKMSTNLLRGCCIALIVAKYTFFFFCLIDTPMFNVFGVHHREEVIPIRTRYVELWLWMHYLCVRITL